MPEDYVHRIGRTGRAGNEGEAMSLVCVDEHKLLKDIERLIKRDLPKIVVDGYEPDARIKAEPIQNGRNRGGGNRDNTQAKRSGPRKNTAAKRSSDAKPWANSKPKRRSSGNNKGRAQQGNAYR